MHLDQQGNVKTNIVDKSILAHFTDCMQLNSTVAGDINIQMQQVDVESLKLNLDRLKNLLSKCDICEKRCLADRNSGKIGKCGLPGDGYIYQSQLSYCEETDISPTYEIYFAGCNIACNFCHQTEYYRYREGFKYLSLEDVIEDITSQKFDIRTISYLGGNPDHSLSLILKLVIALNLSGIKLPHVFNSNFLFSNNVKNIINECFDVFIADFKFGNNNCAFNIANCRNYVEVVKKNILGLNPVNPFIIRHMPLTGHWICCSKPVIDWIVENNNRVTLHLSLLESLYSDNSLGLRKAKNYASYMKIETIL